MSFNPDSQLKILREGPAMRVMFYYAGEEGAYVDNPYVILFENGIVHVSAKQEETTTTLQNCEILWKFISEEDRPTGSNIRLLKESREDSPPPSS